MSLNCSGVIESSSTAAAHVLRIINLHFCMVIFGILLSFTLVCLTPLRASITWKAISFMVLHDKTCLHCNNHCTNFSRHGIATKSRGYNYSVLNSK